MSFDADTHEPDDALLQRFADGDQSAARALTLRLTPRALAVSYRMLGDRAEAEDVAQEAMMRLWKIAPDWRVGEAKVSTWLHRVVSNLSIDRIRKRRRSGPGLDEVAEPQDPAPSAVAVLMAADRASAVRMALDALPDRQKQAVTLRHFEGLGNPEIGEIMEISIEAVESLLSRGRRALATAMRALGDV